jgi:hypothetical protein
MKNLLCGLVVIALLIAGLGLYRGWFEFGTKKEDNKPHAGVNVDTDKFKEDKEHFKTYVGEKSKALREKLERLHEKARGLAGDAKVKAQKEIEVLGKKREALETKMKELEKVTEDKFESFRKSVSGHLDDDEDKKKEDDK